MICEKCQKNEVSVHLTDIVNNTKREYHLCRDCAQSHGVSIQAQLQNFKNLTVPEFYASPQEKSETANSPEGLGDCPDCGMSYSNFRKEGKFGCSRDYDLFSGSLDDLFEKIHAAAQHKGRSPARFHEQMVQSLEVERLRESLTHAVSDEDFEQAAAIRDQLRILESGS